jgi:hypothetical protein
LRYSCCEEAPIGWGRAVHDLNDLLFFTADVEQLDFPLLRAS